MVPLRPPRESSNSAWTHTIAVDVHRWWASTTAEQPLTILNTKNKIGGKSRTPYYYRFLRLQSVYERTDLGHQMCRNDRAENSTGNTHIARLQCRRRPEWLHPKRTRTRRFRTRIDFEYILSSCRSWQRHEWRTVRLPDYLTTPLDSHLSLCMIRMHLECTRIIWRSWKGVIISLWTMDQLIYRLLSSLLLFYFDYGYDIRLARHSFCYSCI